MVTEKEERQAEERQQERESVRAMGTAGDDDCAAAAPAPMDALLDTDGVAGGPLPASSLAHEARHVFRANWLWRSKHEQDEEDLRFSPDANYEEENCEDALTLTGTKCMLSLPGDSTRSTSTTRKTKKRRHHEVLCMRETAGELERELSTLKHRQERAESAVLQHADSDASVRKWQKAAKKEMQATARARLENAKLREKVNAQAEFANTLQETLSKRQYVAEEEQEYVQGPHDLAAGRASAKENDIYEQLINSVHTRACDQEVAFQMSRFAEMNNPRAIQQHATISDAKILLNEEQALCIDMKERYILPFDFKAGAQVLWTYVLSRILALANQKTQTEVILSTNDLIVTKQTASSNMMIEDHQFTTEYSATKRICYANAVDFLWESITQSNGSMSQGTPAIQLVQKGWGKIMRVETANGSSAASVLACTRLTPSAVDADSFAGDASHHGVQQNQHLTIRRDFDVGRLAAHIISGYRQYSASIRVHMENVLIDDMLNPKARQRR